MKQSRRFSGTDRIRSFSFALSGIVSLVKYEHNARIHLAALLIVVVLGFVFDVELWEWALIAVSAGLVFMAELFNTAVERLADYICSERDEKIRLIKDYAAGAVLIAALLAVVIGLLVFIPHISSLV